MADPDPLATQVRGFVAYLAAMQIGSHYLWGTAGNSIGTNAGGKLVANNDSFTSVKRGAAQPLPVPAKGALPGRAPPSAARECWGIETAYSVTGGQHVCAGRFKSVPLGTTATYFTNRARQDPLLANYVAFHEAAKPFMNFAIGWMIDHSRELGPLNPGPQPFFATLTPRVGYANVDAVSTVHQQLIWGESCIDKRHFDCVGLVNAAYAAAVGDADITFEIFQWGHRSVTQRMGEGDPVLPGDILCVCTDGASDEMRNLDFAQASPADARTKKWHHIGLCMGDEQGSIVQAEEGPVGVTLKRGVIDPRTGRMIGPSKFNYRGRVPDSTLAAWRRRGDRKAAAPQKK
ncbi:MAG: hypothetical protein JWR10_2333 [Rubritepida sp.]|nr:hypothetical protein [Rubritepida sp.]